MSFNSVYDSFLFICFFKGENNSGHNRDLYQCNFPAMITEWRKIWSTFTPTSSSFPFGFMQLGTMGANNPNPSFPVIRWHQTADYGFVPNEVMEVNNNTKIEIFFDFPY